MEGITAEERAARVHPKSCGECNLCCKLLPVADLHAANTWCQHAKPGKGCSIYADRPMPCRAWACLWVQGNLPAGFSLKRPDKAHYVLDEATDIVGAQGRQLPCLQVWVDPGYPTAWRTDGGLRRLMLAAAEEGSATLIRYGDRIGRLVLAPPLSDSGAWEEHESEANRRPFTIEEQIEFFKGRGE